MTDNVQKEAEKISVSELNEENFEKIARKLRECSEMLIMDDKASDGAEPEAIGILLSPERYVQIVDEMEDAKLYATALERLAANPNLEGLISQKEVEKEFGLADADTSWITDEDLEFE